LQIYIKEFNAIHKNREKVSFRSIKTEDLAFLHLSTILHNLEGFHKKAGAKQSDFTFITGFFSFFGR
jgi:hypothetical protein